MLDTKRSLLAASLAGLLTIACSSTEDVTTDADASSAPVADTRTATEILDAMVADCEACAEACAARHAETPLYERLGGHEKIAEFVDTLIELHLQNELVKPYLEDVDLERLSTNLVDFIGAGTGGTETYEGRSVAASHAGMGITPEVFLAAGADIGAAMEAVGWGPDEQQELLCIILSMKDDVL